jgi:hypothetical protein
MVYEGDFAAVWGTFLFNPAAPVAPLKHAPPMRRSRLEMAKLQIRPEAGRCSSKCSQCAS